VLNTDQQAARAAIKALNDELRCALPLAKPGCLVMATSGVRSIADERLAALVAVVRDFKDFTPDNDPHGEHDFGAVEHDGVRYFWKIDAYDRSLTFASPDPADSSVTTRVLTIMRADEY
jgi:Protein of unknown function (DUF3768)